MGVINTNKRPKRRKPLTKMEKAIKEKKRLNRERNRELKRLKELSWANKEVDSE